jgi:uncharacterized protein (TIGR03089 family)
VPGPDLQPATPDALLRRAVLAEPGRPFVTYYDDATGDRVELSLATFDNWVAKTAGLLRDGLDVQPGDRVLLEVPLHWQSLALICACWTCGAVVDVGGLAAYADGDVVVTGADTAGEAAALGAAELVVLSLRPLGGPSAGTLPPGATDHGREVPTYPDRYAGAGLPPGRPALVDGAAVRSATEVVSSAAERAGAWGVGPGARVLTTGALRGDGLAAALTVPLAVGGSVVLCRNVDPARVADRIAVERVSVADPGTGH